MGSVALTGSDTIEINNRILADLADGDCAVLTFANDIANVKTGKNGNAIYALNETGRQAELVLRVIRGSADDKFLNNLLVQMKANFAGFPLLVGEFNKQIGDNAGTVRDDKYIVSGGIFSREVDIKNNVEGDTEQSVAVYRMKFSNAPRVIT